MQQSGVVADYLDALARELSFDMALSRRVRREVEDHLWETTIDEAGGDSSEAQRRAVANFGDPREIARQYAALSLLSQTRRIGAIAVLALTGIFMAMKGRGAWYGLVQWGLGDHLKNAYTIGLSIDRYAFMIGLAVGVIGWAYIASRRAPTAYHKGYRIQVTRCVMFCTVTAGALLATVVTDTILTGLRLFEARLSASALVPLLSMGIEIAFVSVLILHIRATIQRMALVSSLQRS
jgi:hypothetical protein